MGIRPPRHPVHSWPLRGPAPARPDGCSLVAAPSRVPPYPQPLDQNGDMKGVSLPVPLYSACLCVPCNLMGLIFTFARTSLRRGSSTRLHSHSTPTKQPQPICTIYKTSTPSFLASLGPPFPSHSRDQCFHMIPAVPTHRSSSGLISVISDIKPCSLHRSHPSCRRVSRSSTLNHHRNLTVCEE